MIMPMSTPKPIVLYGITNCDTVKKARAWLTERGVPYTFHDFRKSGVDAQHLHHWAQAVGWEALLNRRGTTWRGLAADIQASARDEHSACALTQALPSLIKQAPGGRMGRGRDRRIRRAPLGHTHFVTLSVAFTQLYLVGHRP